MTRTTVGIEHPYREVSLVAGLKADFRIEQEFFDQLARDIRVPIKALTTAVGAEKTVAPVLSRTGGIGALAFVIRGFIAHFKTPEVEIEAGGQARAAVFRKLGAHRRVAQNLLAQHFLVDDRTRYALLGTGLGQAQAGTHITGEGISHTAAKPLAAVFIVLEGIVPFGERNRIAQLFAADLDIGRSPQ